MNKLAKTKKLLCLLIALIMTLTIVFAACQEKNVQLVVLSERNEGVTGDTWNLSIACAPGDYETTVSHPDKIIVERKGNANTVKIVGEVTMDTDVTITVTSKEDPDVKETVVIKVKAPTVAPEISLSVFPDQIGVNDTSTANAVVAPAAAGTVEVKVTGDNAKYVEITAGNVIRVKESEKDNIRQDIDVTVTASLVGNSSINVSKTLTIKGPEAGTWISLSANTYNVSQGETSQLVVKSSVTNFTNKSYEYNIENTDLIRINPTTGVLSVINNVDKVTPVKVKVILLSDQSVVDEKTFNIRPAAVPITITLSTEGNKTSLESDPTKNDSIKLNVNVPTGDPVEFIVSNPALAEVVNREDGVYLVSKGTAAYDRSVTVTAQIVGQTNIQAFKSFVLKAPVQDGKIQGKHNTLTQAMINEAANLSITVTAKVVDYFEDYHSKVTDVYEYSSTVKMEDGKWMGTWIPVNKNGQAASNMLELTTAYRRGTTMENSRVLNRNGQEEIVNGYISEKMYINKNNEVTYARQTDMWGSPFLWQEGHMWNHLGDYGVNCYSLVTIDNVPDEDEGVDYFTLSVTKDLDTYYWLTYLSYSFTPMMTDTLDTVYLKVKDNHIVGLFARTEYLYDDGNNDQEHALDSCSYSEVELTFSDIGATVVPEPQTYSAPTNADKLQAAFDFMKTATNFTFNAVDTTTQSPTINPDDYLLSSGNGGIQTMSTSKNHTSNHGTVGWVGKVTENQILFEKTGMYSSAMDDNLYHIKYNGYFNNHDGTYEEFEYNSTLTEFEGKRLITGNMLSLLPQWDLSPNVFKFVGESNGNYTFELIDTEIIQSVALQISMHNNASNGAAESTSLTLRITVDSEGRVVQTRFPYNVSDNYIGYVTTTFSNYGTTEFAEEEFANYYHREISQLWANYSMRYYYPNHSSQGIPVNGSAQDVLNTMFGEKAANFPNPLAFVRTFDDDISGPFFDWKETVNSDSSINYSDYFSFTARTDDYDENQRISQETFDRIVNTLLANLNAESNKNGAGCHFVKSTRIAADGIINKSNRYQSLIDEENNFQIVIENNHTKHFWIYIFNLGDWSRAEG